MSSNPKKRIDATIEKAQASDYHYPTPIESDRIGKAINYDDNNYEVFFVIPSSIRSYRDRNYIIKDIILKLAQHGELNKSNLISYCGLNARKHSYIIDDLILNELISKNEVVQGKRIITIYKPTVKGLEFCRSILQTYEKMFPRKNVDDNIINKKRSQA